MTELRDYICAHCGTTGKTRSETLKFCSLGCCQAHAAAENKQAPKVEAYIPPWMRKPPGTRGMA